ncbi:hypothetical protein JOQ06_012178, partial [Pogonophryne albipinna]
MESVSALCSKSLPWTLLVLALSSVSVHATWKTGLYKTYSASSVYQKSINGSIICFFSAVSVLFKASPLVLTSVLVKTCSDVDPSYPLWVCPGGSQRPTASLHWIAPPLRSPVTHCRRIVDMFTKHKQLGLHRIWARSGREGGMSL